MEKGIPLQVLTSDGKEYAKVPLEEEHGNEVNEEDGGWASEDEELEVEWRGEWQLNV